MKAWLLEALDGEWGVASHKKVHCGKVSLSETKVAHRTRQKTVIDLGCSYWIWVLWTWEVGFFGLGLVFGCWWAGCLDIGFGLVPFGLL